MSERLRSLDRWYHRVAASAYPDYHLMTFIRNEMARCAGERDLDTTALPPSPA